jgi:hypothetical protein
MTEEGSDMKANLVKPIATLLAAAISCSLPLAAGANDQAETDKHFSSNFTPIVNKVREVVLGFSRQEIDAYSKARTPCVTGPEFGAMGVHFINTDNVDGILDVNKPEALIYEPQSNGRARLVSVEYIVPKPAWDALHPDLQDRPALEGHLLNFVDEPNRFGLPRFYEVHVWAFEDNRKGALTDWNPDATCEKQRLPAS